MLSIISESSENVVEDEYICNERNLSFIIIQLYKERNELLINVAIHSLLEYNCPIILNYAFHFPPVDFLIKWFQFVLLFTTFEEKEI